MSDIGWAVPTAVALVAALLIVAVTVIVVRLRRRSPRARAGAAAALSDAEEALLRLDDAANDLDVAFEAADVLADGDAPTELRRARAAVLRGRDRGFIDLAAVASSTAVAAQRRTDAESLRGRLDAEHARVDDARARLAQWTSTHGAPASRLSAARARRHDAETTAGDPAPLVEALRERFDEDDWRDAAESAAAAARALAEADTALAEADTADAAALERQVHRATDATRRAAHCLRAVEDAHRMSLQAAENAADELAAARAEIAAALEVAAARPAECAPDAETRLRAAAAALDLAAAEAERRPRAAIETVTRVREERDAVLGDAPGPRRRLEAARTALPGTLACARASLAAAEAREGERSIAGRLRIERARRELASARAATDAAVALASARAAWHAARSAD